MLPYCFNKTNKKNYMKKVYSCTRNITEYTSCVSLELDFPSCRAKNHCVKGLDSIGASDFLSINTTGAENQFCKIQISVFPHQCFSHFLITETSEGSSPAFQRKTHLF